MVVNIAFFHVTEIFGLVFFLSSNCWECSPTDCFIVDTPTPRMPHWNIEALLGISLPIFYSYFSLWSLESSEKFRFFDKKRCTLLISCWDFARRNALCRTISSCRKRTIKITIDIPKDDTIPVGAEYPKVSGNGFSWIIIFYWEIIFETYDWEWKVSCRAAESSHNFKRIRA